MRSFYVVLCLLPLFSWASGLQCYSCSSPSYGDDDEIWKKDSCINDTESWAITKCPSRMKFCVILRNDFSESGNMISIVRGCSEKPINLDDDVEADGQVAHYRSCNVDKCNTGNGLVHTGNGNDGSNDGGFLVPGSGSEKIVPSLLLSFCTTLFTVYSLSKYFLVN